MTRRYGLVWLSRGVLVTGGAVRFSGTRLAERTGRSRYSDWRRRNGRDRPRAPSPGRRTSLPPPPDTPATRQCLSVVVFPSPVPHPVPRLADTPPPSAAHSDGRSSSSSSNSSSSVRFLCARDPPRAPPRPPHLLFKVATRAAVPMMIVIIITDNTHATVPTARRHRSRGGGVQAPHKIVRYPRDFTGDFVFLFLIYPLSLAYIYIYRVYSAWIQTHVFY